MGWFLSSIGGFQGWLTPRPSPASPGEAQLAVIRDAMLRPLDAAAGVAEQRLAHQIRRAPDLASLWHLRCPLMDLLCHCHGEPRARTTLAGITPLFDGFGMPMPVASSRRRPLPVTVVRP